MRSFNLHTIGKNYRDQTFVIDNFRFGQTNIGQYLGKSQGGHYNIDEEFLTNVHVTRHNVGETNAIILEHRDKGIRSSITSGKDYELSNLEFEDDDWVHFCYADDVNEHYLKNVDVKHISLDFCTEESRERYVDIIDKSTIIFDSRERKWLYQDIKTSTVLVFHDQHGCECILGGKKIFEAKIEPIKDIRVNGSGDMFAAFFIETYLQHDLKTATETSCFLTTEWLKKKNE